MKEKKLEDFLPDKKSSYIKKFNNPNIDTQINQDSTISWRDPTAPAFGEHLLSVATFLPPSICPVSILPLKKNMYIYHACMGLSSQILIT